MFNIPTSLKTSIAALMVAATALGAAAPVVMAQDRDHHDRRDFNRRGNDRHDNYRGRPAWRGDRHWDGPSRAIQVRPRPAYYSYYAVPRSRYFNHTRVYRPYGHPYAGFGFYYRDNDAFRFLGLTALSLIAFNELNEAQQRAHEEAMVEATNAPLGEPIIWNEEGRTGSVTAVRDGQTADGRQCREFQQDVTIDGRRTEAYGTACLQPDGSWEVVNDQG